MIQAFMQLWTGLQFLEWMPWLLIAIGIGAGATLYVVAREVREIFK